MKRIAFAILFALAAVSAADAGGYGRSHYKSYSYGQWVPFHGYWYQWNGYGWSAPHTYVNGVYSLYSVASAPAYTRDWKERLVDAAKLQDDNRAYLQALGALGYTTAQSSQYAQQGDTGYAYSTATIAELYGKTDLNVLYGQAERLAASAQDIGANATAGHLSVVKEQGTATARVAEILARGQVAAEMLRSTEPQASARIETYQNGQGQGVPDGARALQVAPNLIAVHCASCHSGEKNKTDFDIGNITPQWAEKARTRVADRTMPKNNKALPSETRLQIIAALGEFTTQEPAQPQRHSEPQRHDDDPPPAPREPEAVEKQK